MKFLPKNKVGTSFLECSGNIFIFEKRRRLWTIFLSGHFMLTVNNCFRCIQKYNGRKKKLKTMMYLKCPKYCTYPTVKNAWISNSNLLGYFQYSKYVQYWFSKNLKLTNALSKMYIRLLPLEGRLPTMTIILWQTFKNIINIEAFRKRWGKKQEHEDDVWLILLLEDRKNLSISERK